MSDDARTVVAAGNRLGEGVVWCERTGALLWTDIHNAVLWRHVPATGHTQQWPMPERLASFALCQADGWLLLALASRLAFFHLDTGELRPLCDIPRAPDTRANDGGGDRQGRFVFGTLHEPAQGPKHKVGGFFRLNADLTLEALPLPGVAISNSIAFSPAGDTMYFCDSLDRRIQHVAYGDTLGVPATFVDLSDHPGEPDGAAVDAQGGLWSAQWGAARVTRYLPDGQHDRDIHLPTAQPTRPALGGADLSTLYITSAHDGLVGSDRDPAAGDVFAAPAGVRGLPEARFAGDPNAALRS
ncbi:SMP-30/gluconolactonase/LRE family protein [Pseudoxanthomonas sp. JBR18]|uniref:SMP-30/gluconolactonase/LRE family protein n=1 Tax=Pseudoxanthomonas sp. JBR18 TaxID=2969308 RepID=UPI00230698B5|nr:SMP-30/gluconolactonase/LRE family protein [Pseudoxanthomonas sp. JBR18]WCE03802.1 SMP-30/gluconolactonase/LRE family protein [Pseudoxanthomonas sp. JBR18]